MPELGNTLDFFRSTKVSRIALLGKHQWRCHQVHSEWRVEINPLKASGESGREVAHTFGPLDGSIYATVAKKVSPVTAGTTTISSPRTVSMDSGISSAENGLQNNNSNASSSSPPATSNLDTQRAWDELLREMQITVESIPDTSPRTSALPRSATYAGPTAVRSHRTRQTVTSHSTLPTSSVASGVSAFDDLESVAYIDDPDEIPYHARQDSRPFTYGAAPGPEMLRGQPGLSSPSLVRKASFGKGSNSYGNSENKYDKFERNSWTLKPQKTENPWAARSENTWTMSTTPRNARSWDTTDSTSYRWRQTSAPITRKSFDFLESSTGTNSNGLTNGSVTWLQRQQQKLRERREAALRMERRPQEVRLMSELKSQYHHHRPSASHRDGYTSDTTHFADDDDDDDDMSIPLHVQTSPTRNLGSGSGVSSSQTRISKWSHGKTFRPGEKNSRAEEIRHRFEPNEAFPVVQSQVAVFVWVRSDPIAAIDRLFAFDNTNFGSPTELGLLTLAKDDKGGRYSEDALTALISSLDRQRVTEVSCNRFIGGSTHEFHNQSVLWSSQLRDDSLSSWRTASISDDPGSPSRTNSPRPVTPAFPVYPRTPYSNGSVVQFDTNGLPPKSPTAQRNMCPSARLVHTVGLIRLFLHCSRERSHSPSTESHLQYSPRSTTSSIVNGGYQIHSQRSSVHSNSEPPQEVSPAHVKFVRDTSRYWYKPTISREEAINMLRNEPPGTFVVRDSNSFAGAFGLALKVATPPPGKSGSGPDELVRHFLIEPTSRGVRLKGCANEPVFSSLSALVYQHSITNMALPTRLLLPECERRVETLNTSAAQQLLAQGAACNVLYLITVDTESLTGPQAIKKAINQLFMTKPLPVAVIVHFKVSGQGITLTDNKRQIFFRRHYPVAAISHCGLDPDDHRWSHTADFSGVPISSHRCFGFVARKPASKTDNQCHIFAELEPEQPATAIVNFVSKVMMTSNFRSNV
ncbi:hypothetical protein RUM43_008942 [Polyplax serrata]|uniref:SH2 domain-containing protein n=1 Tax=Polyplax serrata TaxID=468196 RepID=A0AAN8S469_POLSC